ncbi:hypothetical protein [Sporolactobacillus terrae]|uniref:hypothetical protein n=1 Tax=Sporolactobacillus terrae TaxID=269673 RepID=UPI00048ECF7E|nr:hypothetical protein [Sporolactobacillus terrae]
MDDEKTETCAYCREKRPLSELKKGKIIFQNSKFQFGRWVKFVDEKTNWYCADKPCAAYDQMAHEG